MRSAVFTPAIPTLNHTFVWVAAELNAATPKIKQHAAADTERTFILTFMAQLLANALYMPVCPAAN